MAKEAVESLLTSYVEKKWKNKEIIEEGWWEKSDREETKKEEAMESLGTRYVDERGEGKEEWEKWWEKSSESERTLRMAKMRKQ